MFILMHQYIKNAPEKLMNILWKPSPKILNHIRDKNPEGKEGGWAQYRENHIPSQAWTSYLLLNSKGPHEMCNQGSSR